MSGYQTMIAALTATGIPFEEDAWYTQRSPRPAAPFGAYAQDGGGEDLWGGDHLQLQVITGTVDLFTRGRGRDKKALVENALDASGVSWALNSIQYESDTRLTHFEWTFEVIADGQD